MAIRRQMHSFEALRERLAAQPRVSVCTELIALGHLYDEGPLTASELGERLRLTSGSVTALINRLEAAGYAERVENPDDRRSVLIEICPDGTRRGTGCSPRSPRRSAGPCGRRTSRRARRSGCSTASPSRWRSCRRCSGDFEAALALGPNGTSGIASSGQIAALKNPNA